MRHVSPGSSSCPPPPLVPPPLPPLSPSLPFQSVGQQSFKPSMPGWIWINGSKHSYLDSINYVQPPPQNQVVGGGRGRSHNYFYCMHHCTPLPSSSALHLYACFAAMLLPCYSTGGHTPAGGGGGRKYQMPHHQQGGGGG